MREMKWLKMEVATLSYKAGSSAIVIIDIPRG